MFKNLASRILIIDDDTRNIFALAAVLRSKGYTCVTAGSAAEGLRIITEQKNIGIVLLDMMMPEMDGYETIHVMRHGLQLDIPVIAVTAQAMVGDREKCVAAGADEYIAKPIDVDQLMNLIKTHLL